MMQHPLPITWMVSILLAPAGLFSQQAPSIYKNRGAGPDLELASSATNAWQAQPHSSALAARPQVSDENRAERDRYADKLYGYYAPIETWDSSQPIRAGASESEMMTGGLPPVPLFPNELIIIGIFTDYDFRLTKSHRAIYTDQHIHVQRVLFSNTPVPVTNGSAIDVFEVGGTVPSPVPSKATLAFGIEPRPFGLVPGHRYILFLTYVKNGDFYLLGKSIDLRNGVAEPNSPSDLKAKSRNKWPFNNSTEADLVKAIAIAVQTHLQPESK